MARSRSVAWIWLGQLVVLHRARRFPFPKSWVLIAVLKKKNGGLCLGGLGVEVMNQLHLIYRGELTAVGSFGDRTAVEHQAYFVSSPGMASSSVLCVEQSPTLGTWVFSNFMHSTLMLLHRLVRRRCECAV